MGVTNLGVYNAVYNVTERYNKFMQNFPDYYEQQPTD